MSVVLVNPATPGPASGRIATPPLGLAYLSASLQAARIGCTIIDADTLNLTSVEVAEQVRRLGPALVGVTAMTPTADAAYQCLEALRPVAPRLVIGGAHASAVGTQVFDECPVELDAAVAGEAEQTFTDFAKAVIEGSDPKDLDIEGVLVQGGRYESKDWPKATDLDSLPFPDRAGLPAGHYRHPLFGSEPVTTMITSRGCPYRCLFCDKHVCGRAWRARSAENVLREIEEIVLKYSNRRIIIYDDLFTLDKQRVIQICKGIVERRLQLKWKCEGRVNRVDRETLEWMRRAGCEMIAYGVETSSEKGLDFLKKDITPEQAREAFRMTREAGIQTLGYFLLGIPGETVEDELETARFAVSLGADYAQFGVISPLPGTELYELAREKGWIRQMQARGPAERGSRRPVILDGYWTLERLDRIARQAHRTFYFRPGYVAKRIGRVRSAGELFAGARQAAGLAGWMLKSLFGKET